MSWGCSGGVSREIMLLKHYVYIFVRKDLSPEQRAIQASHAVLESRKFHILECDPCTMVLIGVKNLDEIKEAMEYVSKSGILVRMFAEPDLDNEDTAFATRPVLERERYIFENFKTLKYERSILYYLKIFIRSIKNEIFE